MGAFGATEKPRDDVQLGEHAEAGVSTHRSTRPSHACAARDCIKSEFTLCGYIEPPVIISPSELSELGRDGGLPEVLLI